MQGFTPPALEIASAAIAPLQTCDPILWANETHRCLFASSTAQFTELQMGLVVSFAVGAPLWAKYRDLIVVGVALAMISGMMFPVLPGEVAGVAWTILFFALATAIFAALYRTVIE